MKQREKPRHSFLLSSAILYTKAQTSRPCRTCLLILREIMSPSCKYGRFLHKKEKINVFAHLVPIQSKKNEQNAKKNIYTHIERETCVILKGFEAESFPLKYNPIPLKYNPMTFEYKIHSIEVDIHYLK